MDEIFKVNQDLVLHLQEIEAIRPSCYQLEESMQANQLMYFNYHPDKLPIVAEYVLQVIRDNYPDLQVPFHSRLRHLEAGKRNRYKELIAKLAASGYKNIDLLYSIVELMIISVFLDAGAGDEWKYQELDTNNVFQRSEGLAVATWHMFINGMFSSDPEHKLQADYAGLQSITSLDLESGLQVSNDNPIIGLDNRVEMLHKLATCMQLNQGYFDNQRLGSIVTTWQQHIVAGKLSIRPVFASLIHAFSTLWPKALVIHGINLGDVWPYKLLRNGENPHGLVPFHKLTQWLCYSLIEPLQEFLDVEITDLHLLTGLPEYRNGGLLMDLELLTLKDPELSKQSHLDSSELVVEWRILTVILLDKIASLINTELAKDGVQLPLASVLQGGTWAAGRKIAKAKRKDGGPPLQLKTSGSIF